MTSKSTREMQPGDFVIADTKVGVGVDSDENLSALTIRPKASFNLPGVNTTGGSITVTTSTGTNFRSLLAVGDRIAVDADTRTVVEIAADGSTLTVDVAFNSTANEATAVVYPSMARFDLGAGDPQVVINDQGKIGLGTMAPNASVDIADGGAGDWRGCAINLRSHQPENTDAWGMVLTSDATGPDAGAAIWLDCSPLTGGSMLTFTLTDANDNETDTLMLDGTGVYLTGGMLVFPGCACDDYTLTDNDYYVFVDAEDTGHTISLPMIVPFNFGRVYYVYKTTGTGNVTIVSSVGEPINGLEDGITIAAQWEGVKLVASMDGWVAVRMHLGNTIVPTNVTADRTISPTDDCLYVDAGADGHTVTLPVLADSYGQVFQVFKSAGAGAVTIAPNGTDQINGVNASKTITNAFDGIKLVAASANTWIATALPAA
jgi:hypothetical protein